MRKLVVIFYSILFCFFVYPVAAVTVDLSNVPTSIATQDFTVNVSVTGASSNTNNYLRAAIYSDASPTSYFGFTYNGNAWYNGTPSPIDAKQFLQIPIDSQGSWSGQLKIKLDLTARHIGAGNYFLKVARYTASATSISDWSNSMSLAVTVPSNTPTLVPTVTPTKTSSTLLATSRPTPTSTANLNLTQNTENANETEGGSPSAEVLSESTNSANLTQIHDITSPTPSKKVKILADSGFNWGLIFISLGGLVIAGACGILGIRYYKTRKSKIYD